MRKYIFIITLLFIIIFLFQGAGINKTVKSVSIEDILGKLSIENYSFINSENPLEPKIRFFQDNTILKEINIGNIVLQTYTDSVIIDTIHKYQNPEVLVKKYGYKILNSYTTKSSLFHTKIALSMYERKLWGPLAFVEAHNAYFNQEERIRSIAVFNALGDTMYRILADDVGWQTQVISNKQVNPPYLFIEEVYDNGVLILSNDPGFGIFDKEIAIINPSGNIIAKRSIRGWMNTKYFVVYKDAIYLTDNVDDSLYLYRISYNGPVDSIKIENHADIKNNTGWVTFSLLNDMIGVACAINSNDGTRALKLMVFDDRLNKITEKDIDFSGYQMINSDAGLYLYNKITGDLLRMNESFETIHNYQTNCELDIYKVIEEKNSIYIIFKDDNEFRVTTIER